MKIALVHCPVWGTREPPLSIVSLAASLKSRGHEVKSFDINNRLYKNRSENMKNLWAWEQSFFWYDKGSVREYFLRLDKELSRYYDEILKPDPQIIGFSIAASSYYSSVEFAKALKKINKGLIIVFGGKFFNTKTNIDTAFEETPVDYIIQGEGDIVFPELAEALEKKNNPADRPGVYFKKNDQVVYSGVSDQLKNLDNLPYMDFSDLKINDYDDNEHMAIMSSRGCVWSCSFCSSRAFWNGYREMSAERLHQEIVYHKSFYPEKCHIDFQDLVFNANISRLEEFCDLLINYPPFGDKIVWTANAIVNAKMTKPIIEKMVKAGCKKLIFGIESGSQRVLNLMNKKYNVNDAKRIIKEASEAGIKVTGNFMFGFPGETDEDFKETLDFIRDTGKYFERVYPSRSYCAIEESSEMYNSPEKFGIKTPFSHHLYWESLDGKNIYPVRLKRCKDFEKLCLDLNVRIDCGVKTSVEADEWFNLGYYYDYLGDSASAIKYFGKFLAIDPNNEVIVNKVKELQKSK
jgi:radical SAM superfamily enzyme YgiQ (UPF0313 family)